MKSIWACHLFYTHINSYFISIKKFCVKKIGQLFDVYNLLSSNLIQNDGDLFNMSFIILYIFKVYVIENYELSMAKLMFWYFHVVICN